MTFPTKADIEFFKEAKRIQELWEPKRLDFVYDPQGDEVFSLAQALIGWGPMPSKWIFVPRQGQLQAMLEERGIDWKLSGNLAKIRLPGQGWADEELTVRRGPTPSIALGKCLLEVLK